MTDKLHFQRRIVRFANARRRLRNATLGYRLAGLALALGIAALLLLSGHLPNALLNVMLFAAMGLGWPRSRGSTSRRACAVLNSMKPSSWKS